MAIAVPLDTAPMEAKSAAELPTDPGWQFEPKWDGFRCLAFRDGGLVELRAKSGKPLTRYFPEMAAALLALPASGSCWMASWPSPWTARCPSTPCRRGCIPRRAASAS